MIPNLIEVGFITSFAVMNTIGLIAFELVGATKTVCEEFDLFGVTIVGLSTAFASGAARDILVNRIPLVLRFPIGISLGLLGVGLAIGLTIILESPDDHPITLIADTIGLTAFATAGATVATEAGVSSFGVIATINAVGGGAFTDILLDQPPFILFDDFYASCTVLGSSTHWLIMTIDGSASTAAAMCTAVMVGTRLAAVSYELDTSNSTST